MVAPGRAAQGSVSRSRRGPPGVPRGEPAVLTSTPRKAAGPERRRGSGLEAHTRATVGTVPVGSSSINS